MRENFWRLTVLFVGLSAPSLMFADGVSRCDLSPDNLVQNCGFETGDFSYWDLTGDTSTTFVSDSSLARPKSGDYFAALGSVGTDAILSQTISTEAGAEYNFSFWLASDGGTPNDFTAWWDGTAVFSESDIPWQPYILESFTVTATSSLTTIEFDASNTPGYLRLDDVNVVAAEPNLGFLGSLLLGLSLIGLRRFYRAV